MLKRTHPDIVSLTEQLEHTNFLLERTIPFCRAKAPDGTLDFDAIHSNNHSRCLIGWHQHLDADFQPTGVRRFSSYHGGLPRYWEAVTHYFGLYREEWRLIFGPSEFGSLDQREQYVRRILKPRLERRLAAMLDVQVNALPIEMKDPSPARAVRPTYTPEDRSTTA